VNSINAEELTLLVPRFRKPSDLSRRVSLYGVESVFGKNSALSSSRGRTHSMGIVFSFKYGGR
jgi:hypothetical protein